MIMKHLFLFLLVFVVSLDMWYLICDSLHMLFFRGQKRDKLQFLNWIFLGVFFLFLFLFSLFFFPSFFGPSWLFMVSVTHAVTVTDKTNAALITRRKHVYFCHQWKVITQLNQQKWKLQHKEFWKIRRTLAAVPFGRVIMWKCQLLAQKGTPRLQLQFDL